MLTKYSRDYITKTKGGKFQVKSHAGQVLGTHGTRAEALAQLRAVEYHKAHDATASMGKLELPGATEQEYIGSALDAMGGTITNTPDPLQPHELPERRSNPHHASDPLRERSVNGEPVSENRYLQTTNPGGSPAVDESGALGGTVQVKQPHALENLATERAEEVATIHKGGPDPLGDTESRVPQEEDRGPFTPGGNGDPAPNPSAKRTIGSNPSAISTAAPAEHDEGDPNQYEMLSTSARLHPNEGNEPGYFEAPGSGPDDRKQGYRDPAGDDDFLAALGAGPRGSM